MGPGLVSEITTFEQLIEFMMERIERANDMIPEAERAMIISDLVYEVALFALQATPCNGHHQMFLASELLKRLRNFQSPFLVLSRQMGTDDELRAHFDNYLKTTANWRQGLN